MVKLVLLASGNSYHATRWANSLSERGLNVTFITIHKINRPLNEKIKIFYVGGASKFSYLIAVPRVRKIIKSIKPDIVHSHSAGGYGLLGLLCGFRPWILSVYGSDIYSMPHKSIIHWLLIKSYLKNATKILSTSKAMAERTVKTYNGIEFPIVTPFGVELKSFKKRKIKNDNIVSIGIVKSLEKKYGIDILIRAFEILTKKSDKNLELHIVGEGNELKKLIKLKNNTSCSESIFFHGAIPNSKVPDFLNNLDIFVVPSRSESESFGVAAVEASAMELPVIVSNVGGLPEVIENGKTGLVVPKENPDALCEAMIKLINDKNYRKKLGLAGCKKVEHEYDWDKNVSLVINIYNKILSS